MSDLYPDDELGEGEGLDRFPVRQEMFTAIVIIRCVYRYILRGFM